MLDKHTKKALGSPTVIHVRQTHKKGFRLACWI